jgi:putative transposase
MFDLKRQVVHGACKFRIYPSGEQKQFFEKHFGCCRLIYNYTLIRLKKAYKRRKESISTFAAKKWISALKKISRYVFLKDVNSQSLQASVLNLGKAWSKFFAKKGGYPNLKKKNGRQSFEVPQNFILQESSKGNCYLIIPKLGSAIKIKVHRKIPGKMRHVVISKEVDGLYYASINYVREEYCVTVYNPEYQGKMAGFDLGLIDLYKDSDGNGEKVQRFLREDGNKVKKSQREVSRKKKGSNNRNKSRLKLARVHSKIKNKRRDFIHKQSNKIVNENQVIYFETLNVKGMMRNHRLAKSFVDAMLGEFKRQVKYKCKWRNKVFIQIGRFEPSSKLCSNCGKKNNNLKLHHRTWVCNVCHASHDRDVNAAINIKKIGQGMSKLTSVERSTAGLILARKRPSWLVEAGSES